MDLKKGGTMAWKTKRDIGSIFIRDEISDGPGMRNTRKFLQDFFNSFIKFSVKNFKVTDEYPFNYRERQAHSVLFPAIVDSSDAAFVEQPVNKRIKNKTSSGRIDYWVAYGDSVFIIEAKHSWQRIRKNQIRKDSQNKWKKAYEQIKSVRKKEALELAWDTGSLVKLILHVMPTYSHSVDEQNLFYPPKKNTLEVLDHVMGQLNPKPNWGGVWAIQKDLIEIYEMEDKKWECYPSVMILVLAQGIKVG